MYDDETQIALRIQTNQIYQVINLAIDIFNKIAPNIHLNGVFYVK